MSAAGGAFGRLAEARRAMEEGLALLDGASAGDPDVPNALGRLAETVAGAGDFAAMRESVPAEDRERLDDEMEDLLRLNAVLTAAVKQDRDALVRRLKVTRESRRDLARQVGGAPDGAGNRCDVSG